LTSIAAVERFKRQDEHYEDKVFSIGLHPLKASQL